MIQIVVKIFNLYLFLGKDIRFATKGKCEMKKIQLADGKQLQKVLKGPRKQLDIKKVQDKGDRDTDRIYKSSYQEC